MGSAGDEPKVLIVEDEAIISLDIKRLLSTAGYGVAAVAATSEQAIRLVESSTPDLVLMDIHLKGPVDGIETALQIRKQFKLPVVFVTAHADKNSLERARQSEPFGYIVKPISALSLTSSIEMALHKHRIERQLEEHRAWLDTVLENIPHAVVVTDLSGQLKFINSAGEQLMGVERAELVGKAIDQAVPLSSGGPLASGEQSSLASQLLDKAEWGNRVSFPKETLLRLESSNGGVRVEGEVAMSYAGGEPAGAIFTLRDVSRREQEENMLRLEERMLALGQLAASLSRDFSSLYVLLDNTCEELAAVAGESAGLEHAALREKIDTIRRVGAMGSLMAGQLTQLNQPPSVRATYISASGVVASVEPLLNKLGGPNLQIDIHLTDESTLVLCHLDRLQMLLLNVFLNARERMAGAGRLRISTRQQMNGRVGIVFDIEHMGTAAWKPLAFPLEMEAPDFSLSIAQAIVTAMGGSISFKLVSDTQGAIEILLPLQNAAPEWVDALSRRGTVLLVGSDLEMLGTAEEHLEALRYSVIRCASSAEALLLGQLHDSKIDCVIACAEGVSAPHRRKLYAFFSSRNPATKFIRLVPEAEHEEQGWQSISKDPRSAVLERLSRLLDSDEQRMQAGS
jgi:PAS domain S-box-containing protein